MQDNLVEVNFNPQYGEILKVLEIAKKEISESRRATSFMLMVKVDNQYLRFSSSIENPLEIVAQIEIMKHDLLNRMSCKEK